MRAVLAARPCSPSPLACSSVAVISSVDTVLFANQLLFSMSKGFVRAFDHTRCSHTHRSAQMDAVRQPISPRRNRLESLAHLIKGVRSSLTHPWTSLGPRATQQDTTSAIARRGLGSVAFQLLLRVDDNQSDLVPLALSSANFCSAFTLLHKCYCCHWRRVASERTYLRPIQIRGTAVRTEHTSSNSTLPSDQPGTCSQARKAMHISERREVIAYASRFASWTWPRWSSQRRRPSIRGRSLAKSKHWKHSLIGSAATSDSFLLRVQAGISHIQGN